MPVYLCQRYDTIIGNAFKRVQKKIRTIEGDMKKMEESAASEPMPLDKEFSLSTPSRSPTVPFSTVVTSHYEDSTSPLTTTDNTINTATRNEPN